MNGSVVKETWSAVFRDVWSAFTIAIPGLATYGSWRLLLLFCDSSNLTGRLLTVDKSVVLSTAFVAAIAISQQATGIAIECLLGLLVKKVTDTDSAWRTLFTGRFKLFAKGNISDDTRRTVAQFFLSLNVLVGYCAILLYFLKFEDVGATHEIAITLYFVIGLLVAACIYRARIATAVLDAAGQESSGMAVLVTIDQPDER